MIANNNNNNNSNNAATSSTKQAVLSYTNGSRFAKDCTEMDWEQRFASILLMTIRPVATKGDVPNTVPVVGTMKDLLSATEYCYTSLPNVAKAPTVCNKKLQVHSPMQTNKGMLKH